MPARQARELADHLPVARAPITNPLPAAPWSVPSDAFSFARRPIPSRGGRVPGRRAGARLEVALERERAVPSASASRRARRPLGGCRTSPCFERDAASGSPSASIAARPAMLAGTGRSRWDTWPSCRSWSVVSRRERQQLRPQPKDCEMILRRRSTPRPCSFVSRCGGPSAAPFAPRRRRDLCVASE